MVEGLRCAYCGGTTAPTVRTRHEGENADGAPYVEYSLVCVDCGRQRLSPQLAAVLALGAPTPAVPTSEK